MARRIARGLVEIVVDASGRIGETKTRIEWVLCIVDKVNVAIGVGEHCLIFPTTLEVDTSLQRVFADDLREIIDDVEGPVVVEERRVVSAKIRAVSDSTTIKVELRNVVLLNCRRVNHRQVGESGGRTCQPTVCCVDVDLVLSETNSHFVNGRRVKRLRRTDGKCPTGTSIVDSGQWQIRAQHERTIER